MSLKNASSAERKAVFIETSARIGIRPDMVEKDFWVTWVLNQLFGHDRIAKIFLFKGGTSLSKAYNSIKRFSEDIDLLLDLREVSDPGETFEKERSKNAITPSNQKPPSEPPHISEKLCCRKLFLCLHLFAPST